MLASQDIWTPRSFPRSSLSLSLYLRNSAKDSNSTALLSSSGFIGLSLTAVFSAILVNIHPVHLLYRLGVLHIPRVESETLLAINRFGHPLL